jgi:hydroxyacylglutathione hydrolase
MMNIQRFECNPLQENCYVVSDETQEAVVIDCGAFYPEERKAIVNYIRDNKLNVKHLLVTHGHMDHNFGNNTMYDEFHLQPEVHSADESLMDRIAWQCKTYMGYNLPYQMPPVLRYLTEDDVITFGTHQFSIIHTPGHSPGSVIYYCEAEKLAFSGDTIFRHSYGRTDLEGGSYEDMMDSLVKIQSVLPAETHILCGHGPDTTVGEEK